MDIARLQSILTSLCQPTYRHKQIFTNYYSGKYQSFADMSDLPKNLRLQLEEVIPLYSVSQVKLLSSAKSQKALLALNDGLQVESVLMDYGDWLTACVSSQVGCPLNCSFCATGKMGFKRNLTAEEIVDQILFWNSHLSPKTIDRVVFMGMGEPFLNWDNLLSALQIIKTNLGIGSRKISISTAGITPKIIEFAALKTEINLAISLHSLDQQQRLKIMPLSRQYPLTNLLTSLEVYTSTTHRQLFLEYALIDGLNDREVDLKKLISLLRTHRLYFLNLIPLNPVKGRLTPSSRLSYFQKSLATAHVNFSLRHSLGQDINSACGQLLT